MTAIVAAIEVSRVPSSERIEAVVTRVRELAEQWLSREPQRVLGCLERQARQILNQQGELSEYRQQLEQLQQQNEMLQQQNKVLHKQNETLQQQSNGSVAPFRLEPSKRQREPKRPGRKAGHAPAWRQAPALLPSDEQIEVSLEACPKCATPLDVSQQRAVEQVIVEVPEVKARVIRLRTYRNHCPCCQTSVCSTHPLQVSQATGAAGTHLGPRALGLAATLNREFGLTMRKTCRVLQQCFGIELSAGGLSQALERIAERVCPDYEQQLERLRQSEQVYCDETGWWVGGPGYTLWVLTNQQGTYYRVVDSRSRESAAELIGREFAGVLVSDCLSIYDDLTAVQQKCYAHHLKAISTALGTEQAKGSAYLLELRALLHSAMLLKRLLSDLSEPLVQQWRAALEERADVLLSQHRGRPDDPQAQQEEKVRQRLLKQRDHLFTFLDHAGVEATNNQAERQLRPAVISRKLSCGNKTERGATTWAILTSLAVTCAQRGESFAEQVAQAMVVNPTLLSR